MYSKFEIHPNKILSYKEVHLKGTSKYIKQWGLQHMYIAFPNYSNIKLMAFFSEPLLNFGLYTTDIFNNIWSHILT